MRINSLLAFFVGLFIVGGVGAVELTGTTSVNVTSDTAAQAKNKAFNSARREVIARELRNYANAEQLDNALQKSSNEELMNIISSSSLDGERISDTTYTANISFVIDGDAACKWMDKYSVQHQLPTSSDVGIMVPENSVMISAVLYKPIEDWIALNAIARSLQIDLATKNIVGNTVSFSVSDKDVTKISNALRENGWYIQSQDGNLKISR